MKIESIIRRADGTLVTLDRTNYTFKPETDDGPHVCEVENARHIAALLAITEGYRAAEGEEIPEGLPNVGRPSAPAPTIPREMTPILLEDDDTEDGKADAEADRAAYLEQLQKDAAERAKVLQDFADADVRSLDGLGTESAADDVEQGDDEEIEVIEPDAEADQGGEVESEEPEADAEPVTLSAETLGDMSRADVATYFKDVTGADAAANATKKAMIAAILEALAE